MQGDIERRGRTVSLVMLALWLLWILADACSRLGVS
jgi:hypothetical protein